MLSTIIDTYNFMPWWSQTLLWGPLPMLCFYPLARLIYKDELNSRHGIARDQARTATFALSVLYPLFIMLLIAGTIVELYERATALPSIFDWIKKFKKKQQLKKNLRKQPKSKPQKEYMHMYEKSPRPRTVCGVGNPNAVRTTNIAHVVNCPICIGIMKEQSNG